MAELERDLRLLGPAIEFPAQPDLAVRVRVRLEERRPARRRVVVLAFAVVALAVGAAFAVPDSRSAILDFFGLTSVRVTVVEELPPVTRGPASFGEPLELQNAQEILGFRPLLPDLGEPDEVSAIPNAGVLIVVWGRPARVRLIEFPTATGPGIEKTASVEQRIERVTVNGGRGLWIEGPHLVDFFGQPRISASVLVWEQGGLTIRLEANVSKERAFELARSVKTEGGRK